MKSCDEEKLQFINSIQTIPGSYIIIVSKDLNEIVAKSSNAPKDIDYLSVLQPSLKEEISKMNDFQDRCFLSNKKLGNTTICRCNSHGYIIEVEPEFNSIENDMAFIGNIIEKLEIYKDTETLLAESCNLIFKTIPLYDRGMVYKFQENGSGSVIHEIKDPYLNSSYLGLNYPSSDIPQCARNLYSINRIRFLYDIDIEDSEIIGAENIDLTHCRFRSHSKYHKIYLKNMGIKSSYAISIVIDDKLWGMFIYHNYKSSSLPSLNNRIVCDMISRIVSKMVSTNISRENLYRDQYLNSIFENITHDTTIIEFIETHYFKLLSVTETDSICVKIGNTEKFFGESWLEQKNISWNGYINNNEDFVISISPIGFFKFEFNEYIIVFFRKTISKNVKWAGNPDICKDPTNPLTPRRSFETFIKKNGKECLPWSEYDIKILKNIKERFETVIKNEKIFNLKGSLDEANKKYELSVAIAKENKNFFASMSHELRTPFHGVLGCLELIDENLNDAMEMSRTAYTSGKSMLSVLNNILESSKSDFGYDGEKTICSLKKLISTSMSMMIPFAKKNNINLEYIDENKNDIFKVDANSCRHVITNLINNAIKFTETNGEIKINSIITFNFKDIERNWKKDSKLYNNHVFPTKHDCYFDLNNIFKCISDKDKKGLWINISIQDNGCGISKKDIVKIFNPYEQGSNYGRESGTGLGLFICLNNVLKMGGLICCFSTLGKGTIIKFCVPVEKVDDLYIKNITEDEKNVININNSKFNILLVDDSFVNIKITSKILYKLFPKSTIMVCKNGSDAIEKCKELEKSGEYLDILFTDYHMPELSGDILIGKIKGIFNNSKCIIYTADNTDAVKDYLLSMGADMVLVKPAVKNDLFSSINSLLQN